MKDGMQYRALGRSGIKASVVGLGTFAIGGWFYGGAEEKDSIAAIHASIDQGVNLIDTAPIYGYGAAEEVVGKALVGRRHKALIATKAGLVWTGTEGEFFMHADDKWPTSSASKYAVYKNLKPHSILREVELSLKRLRTDYIDLYQTHWQESTTPIEVTMEALTRLKEQGKIRAIGVSNVTTEQLARYGEISSAQEKFSLIDRGIAAKGLIDYCVEHGIAILSYFTLEQGLLTGTLDPARQFPTGDMRRNDPKFTAENREKMRTTLSSFEPTAKKYGITIPQLMIALTAAQRGITHVLIGARNAHQARENAGGGCVELAAEDVAVMNAAFEKHLAAGVGE